MWSKCRSIDNKQAYKELCNDAGIRPVEKPVREISEKNNLAGVDLRNRVYTYFLKALPLESKHKDDLLRRGLSELQIHNNMYKSVPQNSQYRWKVAKYIQKHLNEMGKSLQGIPGFYTRRGPYGEYWDFIAPRGYFIPVKDPQGRIQALQIRLDEGKYVWFSSHGLPNGTSSHAPAHYTGGTGRVWVTEGPLKADIASCLMSAPFIGVPGVNSWKEAEKILSEMGIKDPIIAFDSDFRTNPHVAGALRKFISHLKEQGYFPQNAVWPSKYGKGIDDVLLKLHKKEVMSVSFIVDGVPVTIKRTVTTEVSVG
jgi:peptidoglycan/xylan/chitin deacetylase (PgdA/CDA1 family)